MPFWPTQRSAPPKCETCAGTGRMTRSRRDDKEHVLVEKGLSAFGEGPRGDLYLRIGVQVPERLTRQERELYEKLRDLKPK